MTGTFLSDATISNNNQMLSGYKAYGRYGTLYTGSIASQNGGTYQPSGSAQTISCSGKKMNSNVVINPIPSNYINISGGSYILNGQNNWGPLVNRGWQYAFSQNASTSSNAGWYSNPTNRSDWATIDWSNGGMNFRCTQYRYLGGFVTTGSIDVTRFNYLSCVVQRHVQSLTGSGSVGLGLVKASDKNKFSAIQLWSDIQSNNMPATYTHVLNISGVTGQHFIYFRLYLPSARITNFSVNQIRIY